MERLPQHTGLFVSLSRPREDAKKGEAHEALLGGAQQESGRFLGELKAWSTG